MIGRLTTLEELMKRFFPEKFSSISDHLGQLVGADTTFAVFWPYFESFGIAIPALSDVDGIALPAKKRWFRLERILRESDLPNTALVVREMGTLASQPDVTLPQLSRLAESLARTLKNELSLHVYLGISPREADFYEMPRDGWEEIIQRYPDSIDDIESASKCWALGQYVASVYHSTQIVEFGVIDLGRFLGVTDYRAGYTATTGALKKLIATPYPDWPTDFKGRSESLRQLHERLLALETAWRNKISHAQGKLHLMKKEFSPDVAEEILLATRAFMRVLSTEIPAAQEGKPTA